ncbi:hypothetical protein Fcan01_25942 [Folsomia candida]|uniref:Uncharacterized protein n=1 Tax=Folsomia candida TaxID=158441 RepID=A0A226D264_FOLCA|nr:hypothetical protein Fcan01_25942 [Folsomia candida]
MLTQTIIFTILLKAFSASAKNDVSLPQAQISHLLENMTNCDCQIAHDGSDIGHHGIPLKVIWIPAILKKNRGRGSSPPAINALAARVPQQKLIFIVSTVLNNPKSDRKAVKSENLKPWVEITLRKHIYHLYNEQDQKHLRYYHHNANVFVIFITAKQKKDLYTLNLYFFMHFGYSYSIVISHLNKDNKTPTLCGVPKQFIFQAKWTDCFKFSD